MKTHHPPADINGALVAWSDMLDALFTAPAAAALRHKLESAKRPEFKEYFHATMAAMTARLSLGDAAENAPRIDLVRDRYFVVHASLGLEN